MRTTIAFFAGILASGVGAYIVHRFAMERSDRESLRKIVNEYKSIFSFGPIQIRKNALNGTSYNDTLPIFRDAVSVAWIQLPCEYQIKLEKAWEHYQGADRPPKNQPSCASPEESINASSEIHPDEEASEMYHKRFNNLHNCLDDLLNDISLFRKIKAQVINKFYNKNA